MPQSPDNSPLPPQPRPNQRLEVQKLEVPPTLQRALDLVGGWKSAPLPGVATLNEGSKIPTVVYEPNKEGAPHLAVLSTTRFICRGQGACLSNDGKVIFIGEAEIDAGTFANRDLLSKADRKHPEASREKLQTAVVRFELTLAETGGDLYKAYEQLLTVVRDGRQPQPKEVLSFVFRMQPLDQYLLTALCYGHGDEKRASEYLHQGKSFGEFVKARFRDAKAQLVKLKPPGRDRDEEFNKLLQDRNALLNPESELSLKAIQKAETGYKELTGR